MLILLSSFGVNGQCDIYMFSMHALCHNYFSNNILWNVKRIIKAALILCKLSCLPQILILNNVLPIVVREQGLKIQLMVKQEYLCMCNYINAVIFVWC